MIEKDINTNYSEREGMNWKWNQTARVRDRVKKRKLGRVGEKEELILELQESYFFCIQL